MVEDRTRTGCTKADALNRMFTLFFFYLIVFTRNLAIADSISRLIIILRADGAMLTYVSDTFFSATGIGTIEYPLSIASLL